MDNFTNNTKNTVVLFLGFGYTAHYLALLLNSVGIKHFSMSSRTNTLHSCINNLEKVTHILVTAPPHNNQDPVLNLYTDILTQKAPHIKWLGYVSSTSVYGNYHGNIITELSECTPTSEHGKNRLEVEHLWQSFAVKHFIPLHIFRLAGIYGTNRNNINNVRLSQTINIIKQGHLSNRIYVKDIATILMASMQKPTPQEIFNLADDMPASTAAINDYISFLLDTPPLQKVAYDDYADRLSDMRKSFLQDNKIVCNQKIKETLNLKLNFPTYREGIIDILASELIPHKDKIH